MYIEIIESRILLAGSDDASIAEVDLDASLSSSDTTLLNITLSNSTKLHSDSNETDPNSLNWFYRIGSSIGAGVTLSFPIWATSSNKAPNIKNVKSFIGAAAFISMSLGGAVYFEHLNILINMPNTKPFLNGYIDGLKNAFVPGHSDEGYAVPIITYGGLALGPLFACSFSIYKLWERHSNMQAMQQANFHIAQP